MYEDIKRWAAAYKATFLTEDKEEVEEAGLSLDDILKKGQEHADRRNAAIAADKEKRLEQKIKSIWVKSIKIDVAHEQNSSAELEITLMDGSKIQEVADISTTGHKGAFEQQDRLYKEVRRNMMGDYAARKSAGDLAPGARLTDIDVRLGVLRVTYGDYRIQWFYGKNKASDTQWAFWKNAEKAAKSPSVKSLIAKKKATASIPADGADEDPTI